MVNGSCYRVGDPADICGEPATGSTDVFNRIKLKRINITVMARYDASNTNKSKRSVNRIFSDLDLDFGRNTVTNDVDKIEDVNAVKRSIRNLIQTNFYERPFHPELGSGVRQMLFEPQTPLTATYLKKKS